MRNIVGQIASKEDFFYREREIKRIVQNIEAGANMQIAAPRRVGKSSILYYLKDNPPQGYICIYIEVESARTKNDFFKKIYKEILRSEVISSGKRVAEQFKGKNGFLSRLKGIKLAGVGFDFTEAEELNYEEELSNLLLGLDLDKDKLVLLIDEFPEVILNITQDNKGEVAEAQKFLQANRELRNNPRIREKVQFIYTGSNSLNITVANLDATAMINDLTAVPVNPLSDIEAKEFVSQILRTYSYSIAPDELAYILIKIEWNIPFHFQLLIQEITSQINPEEDITNEIIDRSFNKIMEQRNDHHFEHYVKRLKRIFTEEQLTLVHKLLNALAQSDGLTKAEIYNMAHGIISEKEVKKVLQSLSYDGYVIAMEDGKYKFNSPVLKQWWYNHEC